MSVFTIVEIVVVTCFVCFLALMAYKGRKAWLDCLVLADGEQEVYREDIHQMVHRSLLRARGIDENVCPNCRIVVTNQRVIVAQKTLGSARYVMRFIYVLDGRRGMMDTVPGILSEHVDRTDFAVLTEPVGLRVTLRTREMDFLTAAPEGLLMAIAGERSALTKEVGADPNPANP
jgi:hypothetical protein